MPIFALAFPPINPVIVDFGPIAIRWYGLAYVTGLLFGWWHIRRLVATDRLWPGLRRPTADDVDDLLVWMTLGVVLGGRVGYILFYNLAEYVANPLQVLMIWHGGMSVHGGFAGAALAQILFARRRGLDFLTLFDLTAASVPVGLFFGRLANFVNGELYGRVTDVPWAFVFPNSDGLPRHPSQLYEAGLEGLLMFCLLMPLVWRFRALSRPGLTVGIFGLVYAGARILVETVREPDAQLGFVAFGSLTMGQILSAVMALVALGLVVFALKRPVPATP